MPVPINFILSNIIYIAVLVHNLGSTVEMGNIKKK